MFQVLGWQQTNATLLSVVPHSAYAFYYDLEGHFVHRQKICGISMVHAEYECKELNGNTTAQRSATEPRFVIAYSDGEIEYDVKLDEAKDFLLYTEDENPSMNKINGLVLTWYKKHDIKPKLAYPRLAWPD